MTYRQWKAINSTWKGVKKRAWVKLDGPKRKQSNWTYGAAFYMKTLDMRLFMFKVAREQKQKGY